MGQHADGAVNLTAAVRATLELAIAINNHQLAGSLQSLAGARELLLCTELVPCIAITAFVVLLGLDTGTRVAEGTAATSKVRPASSSRSTAGSSSGGNRMGSGSSREAQP
jgi:hypothetical protein